MIFMNFFSNLLRIIKLLPTNGFIYAVTEVRPKD